MIILQWHGIDDSKRFWGYLTDDGIKYVFWGSAIHKNIRFHSPKKLNLNLRNKNRKYNVCDTNLNEFIIEEFEKFKIIRVLKNGYNETYNSSLGWS